MSFERLSLSRQELSLLDKDDDDNDADDDDDVVLWPHSQN